MSTREIEILRGHFDKVQNNFSCWKGQIHEQQGFIFRWHTYSKNELLDSPYRNKIEAMTEKIGDDLAHWDDRGVLDRETKDFYKKIEKKYHKI